MNEFERKKCEKSIDVFMKQHRPAVHIQDKIDLGSRITGQSVEIYEIRPQWNNPSKTLEHSIAKATYVKTQKHWKIYWQKSNLKWQKYEPMPEVKRIEEFFTIVSLDKHSCFMG